MKGRGGIPIAELVPRCALSSLEPIGYPLDGNCAIQFVRFLSRLKKVLMVTVRLSLYLSNAAQQRRLTVVQIVNDTQGADDTSDHEWISCSH